MASTPLLGLSLPADGTTNWGTLVNTSITALLDSAVAGTTTLSSDADVTLTATTEATNQARQAVLLCTGSRAALRTITAPAQSKTYVIINATTGGFGVKIVGTGPTTGVTVPNGKVFMVAWNGSDFVAIGGGVVNLATDVIGTLPIANGGTGQITQQTAINALVGTQTANRVLRSDGTNSTLSQVALATDVTGILPVANGGTGQSTYTDGQLLIGNSTGNTLTKTTLTASTGISVTNGTGSITIANTAPDQTVVLTGAGATTTSGTYPNFTISSVNTTYGTATTTVNGLIKLGDGTVQATAANTVSADANRTYAIQLNGSGQAVVNVPWASGSGTITGVTATAPVASSGGTAPVISLQVGYGDSQNPYASKTANHVLAAPNGSAGLPTFRSLVAADITGTIPISSGGTNSTATPTAGGVAYGNGSAYAFTSAGTSGQVLTSSGAGAPTWSTPASAGVSSISFASTGLTPSTATTGAVTVGGTLGVANGGTNLSSYTLNGVLYASNTNVLASSSNFVFDGTNVGIGASTPSTYGKFVVGGTGSFTASLFSTSTTLSNKPTLEFRKTATGTTTGFGTNQIGRISFYSQSGPSGTTPTETAYITAEEYRVGNLGVPALKIATYAASVSAETNYVTLSTNGLDLYSGNSNGISYTGIQHVFTGDIVSPALTGTPTAPTAASGTNTTQVATTAFVQAAIPGARGQAFTSNGTFTIPTGVTALKITVVGGGGSANTIVGNAGGNSTVASGTQSITTITGGGGARGSGSAPAGAGAGGTATNGNLNIKGGNGIQINSTGGVGGSTLLSSSGTDSTGNVYGGGAGYPGGGCTPGYPGGGGGTAISWLTGLTPGGTLAVTVGAGGTGGYNGAAGVVIFEW